MLVTSIVSSNITVSVFFKYAYLLVVFVKFVSSQRRIKWR